MNYETAEKIYAGLLGMDAGMRLGAPVENFFWTYERLRDFFGDIRGYLREYNCFAADDDVNGPVIFLRALKDFGPDFTARDAGEIWLNYTRCGKGMFWWGGEDMSTEHRAYMNLKRGIPAPVSGSIARNGIVAAEQIGGEIFIDTWGLVCPGDPVRAADFARRAASVSHDGEGLNGAAFMAAAVAAAFTASSVDEILDTALARIPADCAYRRVVDAVRAFHKREPNDFRACRDYIEREFGADKYPGYCHIIPNAGVCVLDMLYSGGELGRAIEISVMCGFDTDCNASNVGTVLGVFGGLAGVPERYRGPIRDSSVVSSVSGYLNMVDWPTFAKEVCRLSCSLTGETMPGELRLPRPGEMLFDFPFPGSTHGLELSKKSHHQLCWKPGQGMNGRGCDVVAIDGKYPEPVDLSFRASYIRDDFSDEQYDPVFAPRIYPGQTVRCFLRHEAVAPANCTVTPFVINVNGERTDFAPLALGENWTEVSFTLPELGGTQAYKVGWQIYVCPIEDKWTLSRVWVDEITVTGDMDYTVDMSRQREEFGQITPFAFNDAVGAPEYGRLALTTEKDGQAFTGNYYARTTAAEAAVTAEKGAGLILRGQGTRRYYFLGITPDGRAAVVRHRNGEDSLLASAAAPAGPSYLLRAEARGDELTLYVNGSRTLQVRDNAFSYGMVGLAHEGAGKSLWSTLKIHASVD